MHRHRMLKLALTFAALTAISVPTLAAGLPACCAPKVAQPAARPACCPMKAAAAMPKGCCKAPEAPKPDTRITQAAPAVIAGAPPSVALVVVSTDVPDLVVAHVARRQHRAPSPDDSPPDRLSRNHVLLI
jgi:hypothetical protein